MSNEKRDTTNTRLTFVQAHQLIDHLKANEGAYRGMSFPDVAKLLSATLGFRVSAYTISDIQKETGMRICGTSAGTRGANTARGKIALLAEFVVSLARQLDVPIPENIQDLLLLPGVKPVHGFTKEVSKC